MLRNRSIGTLYWLSMTTVIVLLVSYIGYHWISSTYEDFARDSKIVEQQVYESEKRRIRDMIRQVADYVHYKRTTTIDRIENDVRARAQGAHRIATHLYERHKNSMTEAQLRNLIRETLRPIRFNNGRGYFFATDLDGIEQLFAVHPELEGKSMLVGPHATPRMVKVVTEMIALTTAKGESYLRYNWTKPNSKNENHPKVAYIILFKPFNWIIGTGAYLGDVEQQVKDEALHRIQQMNSPSQNIFVLDEKRTLRAHPRKHVIGYHMSAIPDRQIREATLQIAAGLKGKAEAFVEYDNSAESPQEATAKIGFARRIPKWDWAIGTETRLHNVASLASKRRANMDTAVRAKIVHTVVILILTCIVALVLAHFFSNRVTRQCKKLMGYFDQAASGEGEAGCPDLTVAEFRKLAESASAMISRRKRLEERVARSEKMESLGRLAGGVAHDLNNVLCGLVSFPDMLVKQVAADSPMRKPLEQIRTSGQRAAAIVEDLLTLARRGVTVNQVLSMNDMVREHLSSPAFIIREEHHPNVRTICNLHEDILNIKGAQHQLTKVLMNLTSNAMEAMADGGEMTVTTRNVHIERAFDGYTQVHKGDFVLLSVSDTGSGISEEDMAHIFEPFYTKKVMGRSGTGLGLAVVWNTVNDLHGAVDVQSTPDEGTTFNLYFPVSREALTEEVETTRGELQSQGERILIVDDLPEQRELVTIMLADFGYEVEAVGSGEEAVEHIRTHKVDLVILDMIMGAGMDGLDTYLAILKENPDQKTIIASGYAETDRVKRALKFGVRAFVKKPYLVHTLAKTVKDALAQPTIP
jgi:signal transduction histidine kinase/ActR/RegA family two-component response regulator